MVLHPSRSPTAVAGDDPSAAALIDDAVRAIDAECAVALGSDAVVAAACDRLRAARAAWWTPPHPDRLATLLPLLSTRTGAIAQTLFALACDLARDAPDPLPFLRAILSARQADLAARGIELGDTLTTSGRVPVSHALLSEVAAVADEGSLLLSPELFEPLARWLQRAVATRGTATRGGPPDTLTACFLDIRDRPLRRLAARILDLDGRPSPHLVRRVLGQEAAEFLLPYLDYTRATHLDTLDVAAEEDGPPPSFEALRQAESLCGPALLRYAIDAIGWQHLNRGIEVRQVTGLSVSGGLPLFLSPEHAAIFERCRDAERTGDRFVLIGHGEALATSGVSTGHDDRIARFRASNLVHAEALAELLDLSPFHRARAERLLAMMDRLTADFVALFSDTPDECAPVARMYADLRQRIVSALANSDDAEVVRLVQPFEDPATPGEVRTLHGLKRYLHQRALRLAFRLVEGTRGTNRTATPLVATRDRVVAAGRPIEYVDFEPVAEDGGRGAPYAVQIVVDAFVHQMLHGVNALPSIRIYCYGNEVHYFIAFRNHPVFVRVDFSPPAGGGMIDLEYYGVSKYELSQHPNLGLDAIRACFERLDFAVQIDNTRIHARYDKERARDTADLCARAEALFRVAPYLMDLDWQLGALDISPESRREVERAWADVLARWGVLPLEQMTTSDRRRILLGFDYGPTGAIELPWRGDGPYRDRVTSARPKTFVSDVLRVLDDMGIAGDLALAPEDIAQVTFERKVLRALRQAPGPGGMRPHGAEQLAHVLLGDDAALADGARLAVFVGHLERLLRFQSVGSVNGYDVQRAELVLPGEVVSLAVLRDDAGLARLASFTRQNGPSPSSTDSKAFASILRRRNFPLPVDSQRQEDSPDALRSLFGSPSRRTPTTAMAGEFLVSGTRASGGRAVGLARLGSARRAATDVDGAIFITPHLSPDEGPFLVRAAGVIATGGGVLSHAGLLAAQFERPAIIAAGSWHDATGAASRLQIETSEYETASRRIGGYDVAVKRHLRTGLLEITDGDLVELDADEGIARVYGQDRESLALHDALIQLAAASARVAIAADPTEVLAQRGRQLRAVHLLERLLAQMQRPALVAHAMRELLVGSASGVRGTAPREHAALLRALLDNPVAGPEARACASAIHAGLSQKYVASSMAALREIPVAADLCAALLPRLTTIRDAAAVRSTAHALNASGVEIVEAQVGEDQGDTDRLAAARVRELRAQKVDEADALVFRDAIDARLAHLVEAFDRCDEMIAPDDALCQRIAIVRRAVGARQRLSRARAHRATVIGAVDGGLELQPIVGGKAANLAEIAHLAGTGVVPAWFAITADALDAVLATDGGSLRAAIERALAVDGGDERQRARAIAALFEDVDLPPDLVSRIRCAYHDLEVDAGANASRTPGGRLLVAVRSSACEEDTTAATRAGEFDTFLCVAGEEDLIRFVRMAWAGFWSPRAIHGREVLGHAASGGGGGVIVQRMVAARAAGVVQTINAADRRAGEIVINAAFGLGAGVVSGTVAADHVIVSKAGVEGPGPLRFRYATADKRQQVVFDARAGGGTVITETLYHQRLRPALEYGQLVELARAAARLERAYGYALDIEFAFDSAQLWILQARPVPAWFAAVRETREKYPLTGARS